MLPRKIPRKAKRTERLRCPAHLKFVRGFCCSIDGCDGRPIEAAHVRTGTGGGMAMKPDDSWVLALCAAHHRELHNRGETTFERTHRIDLKAKAKEFAAASLPLKRKLMAGPRPTPPDTSPSGSAATGEPTQAGPAATDPRVVKEGFA